jgi:anti-anti-sigma regulatory factor
MMPQPLMSDEFTITVTAAPGADRASVVLSGDVDLPARPLLAGAIDQVATAAPRVIVVDLSAITYAGAVLVHFLADVRAALPAGSSLVICRAAPFTDRILHLANVNRIATISRDLPV